MAEQQFSAVDVADAGDDLLVHQELRNRLFGLQDCVKRTLRIVMIAGLMRQGIGSEAIEQRLPLRLIEDAAIGGSA